MNAVAPIAPGNPEAEAMLLSALMNANTLVDGIADILAPEDFSEPFFGRIFSVIVAEHSKGRPANPVTLKPYFAGEDYKTLCTLTGSGAEILAARGSAAAIRELAQKRRLIEALAEAGAKAGDASAGVHDVAAIAEAALADLAERETGAAELSAADCVKLVIDGGHEDRRAGVRSGIEALDAVLGPLRPKSFNIVAGRPGMGKSALAISYAIGAAKQGSGVLFVSLEMAADEIGERMAADMCFDSENTRIPFAAITSGNCTNAQMREIARAQFALADMPLAVVDIGSATVSKIDRLIRRYARRFAAREQKLDLVIVDYLGLVRPDRERQKTYEEVSEVSRGMKAAAKQNGIALMALHQLSREVERRADKRPVKADLRDSGQIEQDADSILFLFAPEYYLAQCEPSDPAEHAEWEAEMNKVRCRLDFIVAKRRRGPEAVGRGMFYRSYQAVR